MSDSQTEPSSVENRKNLLTSRKFLIPTFSLFILALAALAGVLGYLYLDEKDKNKNLQSEIDKMEGEQNTADSEVADLLVQIDDLQAEIDEAAIENTELTTDLQAYKDQAVRASNYNAVFKCLVDTIDRHDGFTGWTQSDYNTGYSYAQATGDANLMDAVHDAWYDADGDPVARVNRVLREIEEGIDANV